MRQAGQDKREDGVASEAYKKTFGDKPAGEVLANPEDRKRFASECRRAGLSGSDEHFASLVGIGGMGQK